MLDAASSEVTADFVKHLGNYARVEDKTAPTSNYFYLLKQLLIKMPEEDREHWDASPGLLRLFEKSIWPLGVKRPRAATAPDFFAQLGQGVQFNSEATKAEAYANNLAHMLDFFPLLARLFKGSLICALRCNDWLMRRA